MTTIERQFKAFGYHSVVTKLDRPRRHGARRFTTVVGLVATATSPSARDGSCLFSVYTWQTRDRLIVSRPTSMTCTPLFAG